MVVAAGLYEDCFVNFVVHFVHFLSVNFRLSNLPSMCFIALVALVGGRMGPARITALTTSVGTPTLSSEGIKRKLMGGWRSDIRMN